MRIAARLALASDPAGRKQGNPGPAKGAVSHRAHGYHGIDIVLNSLSALGFAAATDAAFAPDEIVRLRIPGLGVVGAQVVSAQQGQIDCRFMTPLAPGRLSRAIGLRPAALQAIV